MEKKVGVWIDHRKAVVVVFENNQPSLQTIDSGVEPHVRFSSGLRSREPEQVEGSTAEDMRDRQYEQHLDQYYERVLPLVRDAERVWLFGPGEAKEEFAAVLRTVKPTPLMDLPDTADRLTDPQILQKVREHFKLEQPARRLPPL